MKPRIRVVYATQSGRMWLCVADGLDGYQDWSPELAYRGWLRCYGKKLAAKGSAKRARPEGQPMSDVTKGKPAG